MNIFRNPEFFDILGFLAFVYIISVSIWLLRDERSLPKWVFVVLLLVGLAGAIVDGAVIYTFFLK